MPLIKIQTNVQNSDNLYLNTSKKITNLMSNLSGKAEQYFMVTFELANSFMLGGEDIQGAYLDIKGIGGFSKEKNIKFAEGLCSLLNKEMGIDPKNIYITFTDIPASNWGWNGTTFG